MALSPLAPLNGRQGRGRSVRGADEPALAQQRQLFKEPAEPEILQGRAALDTSVVNTSMLNYAPLSESPRAQVSAPPVYYATHNTQPPEDQGASALEHHHQLAPC